MLGISLWMQGAIMYQLILTDYTIWQINLCKAILEMDNGLAERSAEHIQMVSEYCAEIFDTKISAKGE